MHNILVIPDIHGRTFWKEACASINEYDHIVFLGDYMDPYPHEGITVPQAIENFKNILEFASANTNKATMLLGNHDIYYFYKEIGPSRYSFEYRKDIEALFDTYRSLFKLAYETDHTLFTHAGICQGWVKNINRILKSDIECNAEFINSLLIPNIRGDFDVNYYILTIISNERGGNSMYGSCIWADLAEHSYYNEDYTGKFQVFGHTMQLNMQEYYKTYNIKDIAPGNPIITENFAMLDCQRPILYNEQNKSFNIYGEQPN